MGDNAVNVIPGHDYNADGNIYTVISWSGIHAGPILAMGRQLLREVAESPDPVIRQQIRHVLGEAAAVAWDDGPHQDEIHGHRVPGYVPVRVRIRAMFAGLP